MTWKQLLEDLEALEGGLERKYPETSNVKHFARLQLANMLARVREILEAFASDEQRDDKESRR